MAAFLDIEGAFNNVNTASLKITLEDCKVAISVVEWINEMLSSRIITSATGTGYVTKLPTRGTPQGEVLLPPQWLLTGNSIVAYADDKLF